MHNHIVINLTTFRLYYFESDQLRKEYSIGVGRAATPTPPGVYQVMEKLIFAKPEKIDLDFGSRRMVLSSDKTCLHGSWNGPVEGEVSGGCIRMHNQDIEELFNKVQVGTIVSMVKE